MHIAKEGAGYSVSEVKIPGVEYLTESEILELSQPDGPLEGLGKVYTADHKVLIEIEGMDPEADAKAKGQQVVRAGPYKGMTLDQVKAERAKRAATRGTGQVLAGRANSQTRRG